MQWIDIIIAHLGKGSEVYIDIKYLRKVQKTAENCPSARPFLQASFELTVQALITAPYNLQSRLVFLLSTGERAYKSISLPIS